MSKKSKKSLKRRNKRKILKQQRDCNGIYLYPRMYLV